MWAGPSTRGLIWKRRGDPARTGLAPEPYRLMTVTAWAGMVLYIYCCSQYYYITRQTYIYIYICRADMRAWLDQNRLRLDECLGYVRDCSVHLHWPVTTSVEDALAYISHWYIYIGRVACPWPFGLIKPPSCAGNYHQKVLNLLLVVKHIISDMYPHKTM